jgi:predicted ester cyclase
MGNGDSISFDEPLVREIFERFNKPETFFAGAEGLWVERPHYFIVPQNLRMDTREEVIAWFHSLFDAIPDLHMEVEDVVVAGEPGRERITVRWHFTGTFTGAPYIGIAATGKPVDLRGMDLVYIEDGLVVGNTVYFDQLAFTRQIGVLPPEGSLGDRLITVGFNQLTRARKAGRRLSVRR